MAWKDILSIVPGIIGQVGEYFQRKHELKLKKVESAARIEEAKTNAMIAAYARRAEADIEWEQLSIQNSGWKDEYLTLFITALVGACFIPFLQDDVRAGFDTLTNATPFWFQVSFLVVIGSAFGVRVWDSFSKVIKANK